MTDRKFDVTIVTFPPCPAALAGLQFRDGDDDIALGLRRFGIDVHPAVITNWKALNVPYAAFSAEELSVFNNMLYDLLGEKLHTKGYDADILLDFVKRIVFGPPERPSFRVEDLLNDWLASEYGALYRNMVA